MASPLLTPVQAFALTAALHGPLRGYSRLWRCAVTRQTFKLATIRSLSERRYFIERHSRAVLTAEGRRVARALASVVAIIAASRTNSTQGVAG